MSDFTCPVVQIESIKAVPNSDSLEMTSVFETNCIIRKGQLKVGDLAVYIPIEAVIDMTKPQFQGLGIKVSERREAYRVKAVRLRGTYSEGLLVPFPPVGIDKVAGPFWDRDLGTDMAAEWGITKYEEPEREQSSGIPGVPKMQAKDLPGVPRYSVKPLLRNRADLPEGTEVEVTEKIHGCNGRFVYTKGSLHVGSHNTWRKPVYKGLFGRPVYKGWQLTLARFWSILTKTPMLVLNTDEWWSIAKALDLETKLATMPNHVFYGEVYGKVQDLKYGLGDNIAFRVFDIYNMDTKEWFSPVRVAEACAALGLKKVDVLYSGPYNESVDELRSGKSTLDSKTIREGIVIKPTFNGGQHLAYKLVSEEYKLRKNGSEYH